MNDNYLIIIIILLGILSFGVLFLAITVGVIFYKRYFSERVDDQKEMSKSQKSLLKSQHEATVQVVHGQCSNHPEIKALSMCAICGETFCETCTRQFETLHFCPEHFDLFLSHEWVEIESIKTTPDDSEKSMYLYEFKEDKWMKEETPTYIMTHYKINIENDLIESYVKLYVRQEDVIDLRKQLKEQ